MLSFNAPVAAGSPMSPVLAMPVSSPAARKTAAAAGAAASSQGRAAAAAAARHHHIWLVTGPAGCGKSTVAQHLAQRRNLPYVEGDEFHPPANVEKMRSGIPLTDADRWDWLTALREESMRQIAAGGHSEVVLTCSALKRKYRDVIRVAPYFNASVSLHFIYLYADPDVLLRRVAGRQGHYMGANMVQSQLDILEPPQPDETDVVAIDVGRPLDAVNADVLQRVQSLVDEEAA